MTSIALSAIFLLALVPGFHLVPVNQSLQFKDLLSNFYNKQNCVCGVPNRVLRIVGGKPVTAYRYPWLVALVTDSGQQFCGGSIISNNWILTAAHCFTQLTASRVLVFAGAHNLYGNANPSPVIKRVSRIVKDNYNDRNNRYDIALLKLDSPLQYNRYIQPVCLPTSSNFENKMAVGAGWGHTSEGGTQSEMPRDVDLKIITSSDCANQYSRYGISIYPEMLCAGYREGGRDTCQGDSGGPLVSQCGGRYYQAGVVSWGIGCARPNTPGVYTNVSQYANWIYQQTNDRAICFGTC